MSFYRMKQIVNFSQNKFLGKCSDIGFLLKHCISRYISIHPFLEEEISNWCACIHSVFADLLSRSLSKTISQLLVSKMLRQKGLNCFNFSRRNVLMFNVPITFNLCYQEENCQTEKETAKIEWLEFATSKEKTEYFSPPFEILDPLKKSLYFSCRLRFRRKR